MGGRRRVQSDPHYDHTGQAEMLRTDCDIDLTKLDRFEDLNTYLCRAIKLNGKAMNPDGAMLLALENLINSTKAAWKIKDARNPEFQTHFKEALARYIAGKTADDEDVSETIDGLTAYICCHLPNPRNLKEGQVFINIG